MLCVYFSGEKRQSNIHGGGQRGSAMRVLSPPRPHHSQMAFEGLLHLVPPSPRHVGGRRLACPGEGSQSQHRWMPRPSLSRGRPSEPLTSPPWPWAWTPGLRSHSAALQGQGSLGGGCLCLFPLPMWHFPAL